MTAREARHKTLSQLPWDRYPLRVCRSLHHCEVCNGDIRLGQEYFDGGYGRRAHVACIERDKTEIANV